MARLFNIFAKKAPPSVVAWNPAGENMLGVVSFIEKDGRLDSSIFGDLGEKTGGIRGIFTDLDSRLVHVAALAGDITDLRRTFDYFLKQYHDLALLNVSLGREKERLEGEVHRLSDHSARLEEDYAGLRASFDDSQVKLEKALTNAEANEQSIQILGVAKRELEERLQETQSALAIAGDEDIVLRRECEALKIRIASDEHRISDLSERYQDSFEQATSFGERCEALEGELRIKSEQLAAAQDGNARLAHDVLQFEKEKVNLEKLVSDSRAEMSGNFERYQRDIRARDEQLGDLKNELKSVRSKEQMLLKVNADLKSDNERIGRELREAQEINRRHEVEITRYEAKVSRLATDLEAAQNARKQLDQARLAMAGRVDALSQSLRIGEVDNRRLENEVASLVQRNQDMEASHAVSLEQLNLRIHELEGQLEHQMNENAYLSSTFEKMKSA